MPKLVPVTFLLLAACVSPPSSDEVDPPAPMVTPHLEVYGTTQYQAERYERFVGGVERLLDVDVGLMRIHQGVAPRCDGGYCIEDGMMNVYCDDPRLECMPALASAIVDQSISPPLPLLFRAGLVDVLAGGFGHGDVLDDVVDRLTIEMVTLTDDVTFESMREAMDANAFGDLTWRAATIYPAGDFVRFAIDQLGGSATLRALRDFKTPGSWGALDGLEPALTAWRASPARTGRMYRLPIVECDPAYRVPVGSFELPVMVQGVVFAPDVLESISRFGVANFTIERPSDVTVTVTSSVGGGPFVRLESCGAQDPGSIVNMSDSIENFSVSIAAALEPDTYFFVAGSWTGESYAKAQRPEHIIINAVARD